MLRTLISRFTGVREEETGAAALSGLLFFLILCGYYILRPLREEMGLAGGVRNLPWLYLANLGAMLALAPLFGAVATRWSRRRFVPAAYLFFMSNMVVFFALMHLLPAAADLVLGRVFYVWVSVFNMWAVSLFWAYLADGFGLDRGKRLFGFIAVGGSAGAMLGSGLTGALVGVVGRPNLILVSAALMIGSAWVLVRLGRSFERLGTWGPRGAPAGAGESRGNSWSGILAFVRSPYLLAIGGYLFLFTLLSTFLYFEQAEIVDDAVVGREARAALFADIDLWVNALALATQIFLTGRVISRFGVGPVLLFLPALTALGFAALAASPVLGVLVVFQVLRRAGNYALAKPARETLFTILDRDRKYKAKSFIDTFVYRGGDMLGAAVFPALTGLGLGLGGIALVAVPLAVIWGWLGIDLGKRQRQLAARPPQGAEP